jgi:hypothetical protein
MASRRKRSRVEREPPVGWIKSVHYHGDDYTIHPGE